MTDFETAATREAKTVQKGLIATITAHPKTVLSIVAALALIAVAAIFL